MKKKILLFFILTPLFSYKAQADIVDRLLEFQVHGYLNGYYIPEKLDDTVVSKTRMQDSTLEGTLNLTWLISPRSKVSAQLTAQYPEVYEDNGLRADMFSYNHLMYSGENSQVSFAFGRLKNSWVGFNSAQAHPLERPGVTRPLVYLNDVGEVFLPVNGASVYGDAWLSSGDSINWVLYGGYRDISLKTDIMTDVNSALDKGYSLYGTKILYSPAFVASFQAGVSLLRVDYDSGIANSVSSRNIAVLMLKHDMNDWVGTLELAQISSSFNSAQKEEDNQAIYAQITWNPLPSWTSWLRYSYMDYLNESGVSQTDNNEGKGFTLALRYQTEAGWFLGSQVSYLSLPYIEENKYIQKDNTLLLFQLAYYF